MISLDKENDVLYTFHEGCSFTNSKELEEDQFVVMNYYNNKLSGIQIINCRDFINNWNSNKYKIPSPFLEEIDEWIKREWNETSY